MRALSTALPALFAGLLLPACGGFSDDGREPVAAPPETQAGSGGGGVAPDTTPTRTEPPPAGNEGGSGTQLPPPDNVGGSGSDELPPPPPVCDAPAKVLVASCGNGSCHSNPGWVNGDFAADTERAYNFVDKLSVRNPDCGRIIDSRDYSQSFLLVKVRGGFEAPKCGAMMPTGSFKITEEQIDCLASWLQQFQQ